MNDHASVYVSATAFTLTIDTVAVHKELNSAEVDVDSPARFAKQDPDGSTNPDMKVRLGKGTWLVGYHFSGSVASKVLQGHIWKQEKGGTAAEVAGFLTQTLAGGGNASAQHLLEVTSAYADVDLRLSNETDAADIVMQAASLFAVNVKAVGTARVHH